METLRFSIQPLTAFGGAIRGDTLFGQLCWAICNRWGTGRLETLLEGYTKGSPFMICSDAFPSGYLPRPELPLHRFRKTEDTDRKRVKALQWIPIKEMRDGLPMVDWLKVAVPPKEIRLSSLARSSSAPRPERNPEKSTFQPHNTINRLTGTTAEGGQFAPYLTTQVWYEPGFTLDFWVLFDPEKISRDEIELMLGEMGLTGYGRDSSIGLGKFQIESVVAEPPLGSGVAGPGPDALMTLASCAPQGLALDSDHCYYRPFVRFGRHGDRSARSEHPFKTPLLLMDRGAVLFLSPDNGERISQVVERGWVGQGLGAGKSYQLSYAVPSTVHQGYAPCIGVTIGEE